MEDSIISRIPLFEGLSPEEQEELRAMMTQTTLRRGETLFNEGDSGDRLYILLSGKVKLGHASADGRENLLAVLGPGEIVGELTLFDPGPRSTTATAVAPTELLTLDHNQLMTFVESHPQLAKDMLRALAQRLRRTNTALADLVFSDVPGRVAKALLDLADRFGSPTDDGIHVPHDLTQEELAQLVGASRETVNKSLAEFVSRGWIRLEGRAVTLLDVDRLRRRARCGPVSGREPSARRTGEAAGRLTPASTAETTPRLQPEGTGPQARHRARRPRRAARQDRGRLR